MALLGSAVTLMSTIDWEQKAFELGVVFKPGTPINRQDLFSGRTTQIRKVVDTVNQPGSHVMLYGERGTGKTSLSNMLFPTLHSTAAHTLIPHINGVTSDTYSSVWKRIFEELLFKNETEDLSFPEAVIQLLTDYTKQFSDTVGVDQVRRVVHELGRRFLLVVVIDEFDSIENPDARSAMADTVKFLSDRNVPVTVVMIGVADDIDDLIENHRSVERCMMQVNLPRMSRDEIEDVVQRGLNAHGMEITEGALHEISRLSRGLPHYAHSFGLHAGRSAIDRRSLSVTQGDVSSALKAVLEEVQASTKSDYIKAITSARKDARYRQVLLAAALAKSDELGFFYPKDVRPTLSRILNESSSIDRFARHLNAFCDPKRGAVLYKDEKTERPRYRFDNPLLQPYVLVRGLDEKMLTEDDLRETRDPKDPQGRLF